MVWKAQNTSRKAAVRKMMSSTMRCVVLGADGNARLEHRPISFPKSPTMVPLRVIMAGICSTDLGILAGHIPGPRPLIMGHEFVAEPVDALDQQLCVSEINLTCDTCEYCAGGVSNHCRNRTALGISTDGVFAEFVQVPKRNIHILPTSLTPEQGVFVEPLAAAIQSVHTGAITPEMTVGVLGTGRLGLLQVQVLKAFGVQNIVAIGRSPEKIRLAKQLGASETLLIDDMGTQNQQVFDAVIEASGSPNGLSVALRLLKSRGTIVLKSTPGMPAQVDITDIVRREISVMGSRCGPFPEAIALLKQGKIQAQPLISGRFRLEDFQEAFDLSRQRSTVKVLFDISDNTGTDIQPSQ